MSGPDCGEWPISLLKKQIAGLPVWQWGGAAGAALVGLLGAQVLGYSAGISFSAAFGAAALVVLLSDSHWGLCLAAFSIAPFGAVRHEFVGITFYLPELLILALGAKEMLRFVLKRESLAPAFPAIPLALYLGVSLVGVATGVLRGNGIVRTLQDFRQFSEFILIFWLVLHRLENRRQVLQVLGCFVAGATICAVHAILQHGVATGLIGERYADFLYYKGLRSGSFHHANALAGLLVLAVAAAAGIALSTTRRSLQALLVLCIALCLIAEVYTKSRAGWMSMLLCLVFLAWVLRPPLKVLAAGAVCALIFALAMWPAVTQRVATFGDPQDDRSFMDRTQYYTAASYILKAHPWLGLGWGAYYDVPSIIEHKQYAPAPRPPDAFDATVHSLYLQLPAKMGVFGLLSFLLLLLVWIELVWRAFRTRPRRMPQFVLFATITAGLVSFFLQNGIENYFHHPVMSQTFWLLFGLSFLTAHWTADPPVSYRIPAIILGGISFGFACFLAFCLWLATLDSDPPYFEYNINDALAAGKRDKAFNIAFNATLAERPVPLAHALYGKLLLADGRNDEALAEFQKGFAVRKDYLPPYHPTRKPFYIAEGRLALGQHRLTVGNAPAATAQLELARPYADLLDPRFNEYHPVLYKAYAGLGRWDRALEFGQPDAAQLAAAKAAELAEIITAARAAQAWDLARSAAVELARREGWKTQASFLLGTVEGAAGRAAEALPALQAAAAAGHPHAGCFLGAALVALARPEEALQAFLNTPLESPCRPFAVALAVQLLQKPEEAAQRQTLIAQIDQSIATLRQNGRPVASPQVEEGAAPLVLFSAATTPGDGGIVPLLMLSESAAETEITVCQVLPDGRMSLQRGRQVLELHWVRNALGWEDMDKLPAGIGPVPGWIDTARDWFHARPESVVSIEHPTTAGTSLRLPRITWLYTYPIPIDPNARYLLSAGLKGGLEAGWQILDSEEARITEGTLEPAPSGTSAAVFLTPQPTWAHLRIRIDVRRESPENIVENVALFKLPAAQP